MATPEIEGVREALSAWLTTQLAADFPSLKVMPEWPIDRRLPGGGAISILTAGDPDAYYHPPRVYTSTPTNDTDGTVTYAYGYVNELPLQLDCWATTKPMRDSLQAAVRRALSQPPSVSLANGDTWPALSRRGNLSLAVSALYGAIFTFRFMAVPTIAESSGAAEKNEWRSSFRGSADGPLLEQDTIALMKRVHITGKMGPGEIGASYLNQTITAQRPKTQTALLVSPAAYSLAINGTKQLQAIAVYDDGTGSDVTANATWSTNDALVATVSAGLVTGIGAGMTNITATYGGHSGASAITVA